MVLLLHLAENGYFSRRRYWLHFVQACLPQIPKSSNPAVAALALRPASGYPENKRRTFLLEACNGDNQYAD
jgi:hypothetical protein